MSTSAGKVTSRISRRQAAISRSADPLGQLRALLGCDQFTAEFWPTFSVGLSSLLVDDDRPASFAACRKGDKIAAQLKADFKQVHASDHAWSAIRAHSSEADWLGSARRTICRPGWFDDPSCARIVCSTRAEKERLTGLLRPQLLEAASLPGVQGVSPDCSPVVLIDELKGRRFREVYLAADIGPTITPVEQLLAAVSAASVGLHLMVDRAGLFLS